MKRLTSVLATVGLIAAACGTSTPGTNAPAPSTPVAGTASTTTAGPPPADIHIMIEGPLTGATVDLGTEFCNGAKLAAEHGITKGPLQGAKVVIDCVDNPTFDVNVSVTNANRFV